MYSNRRIGGAHPKSKTGDLDVEIMRQLHEERAVGYKRLAAIFALPRKTVADICTYRRRNASIMG